MSNNSHEHEFESLFREAANKMARELQFRDYLRGTRLSDFPNITLEDLDLLMRLQRLESLKEDAETFSEADLARIGRILKDHAQRNS